MLSRCTDIHERMSVILPPGAYDRWLVNIRPDQHDLLVPFTSELMKIWPISMRVNRPEYDDSITRTSSKSNGRGILTLAVDLSLLARQRSPEGHFPIEFAL